MKVLTFRCPITQAVIDSGIETDDDTLRSVRRLRLHVPCPHCGKEHTFATGDGELKSAA
jgi:phage terminase large subunit GpA-like protein